MSAPRPSDGPEAPQRPTRPRRPAPFRPHGTIALFYFAGLFLLFAMLLVAPALFSVYDGSSAGPELQAAAQEAARGAIEGKLGWAFLLALLTAALGTWLRVLPGTRKG